MTKTTKTTKATKTTRTTRTAVPRRLDAARAALELAEQVAASVRSFQGRKPHNPDADVWIHSTETAAISLIRPLSERGRHWIQTKTDAEGYEGITFLNPPAFRIAPSDERMMADAVCGAGLTVTW